MLITQVYKKQKQVTLSYYTGHATIANALVKTCFWSATAMFFDFQRKIVFRGLQKLYFAVENNFFACRIAFLRDLRIWNQDRRAYPLSLYEPTQSIHWLEHRLVFWINNGTFFFSFYFWLLANCDIWRITWDKTVSMSTLANYSQPIQVSFLHQRIRGACAHAVSKEPPTTIDIK